MFLNKLLSWMSLKKYFSGDQDRKEENIEDMPRVIRGSIPVKDVRNPIICGGEPEGNSVSSVFIFPGGYYEGDDKARRKLIVGSYVVMSVLFFFLLLLVVWLQLPNPLPNLPAISHKAKVTMLPLSAFVGKPSFGAPPSGSGAAQPNRPTWGSRKGRSIKKLDVPIPIVLPEVSIQGEGSNSLRFIDEQHRIGGGDITAALVLFGQEIKEVDASIEKGGLIKRGVLEEGEKKERAIVEIESGEKHRIVKDHCSGIVILEKPIPRWTEEARKAYPYSTQIMVSVRVIFGADGKVRNVKPIQTLDYGLQDRVIEAVYNIKFIPVSIDCPAMVNVHFERIR